MKRHARRRFKGVGIIVPYYHIELFSTDEGGEDGEGNKERG